jgi:hypothetical protein
MSNSIENNAYRILGLDVTANQKEILKRYKEIINRLKIDDYPEYDLDISLPKKLRNESSVTDALKKLQSQKSNIKEYFFWFQISDKIDEKALQHIQNKDFDEAIQGWKTASKSEGNNSFLYKKNLAVLYCFLLSNKHNTTHLKESLSLWYELVESDKFWNMFVKKYSSTNEETINQDLIQDFRKEAVKHLSDFYTELHKQYKDNKYIKDFQAIFGIHGERTEKNVLQPIYQSIYDNLGELSKIKIEEDEEVKDKDIKDINKTVDAINSDLKKLKDVGSYDHAESKVIRDRVAEIIREVSVKLHNSAVNHENSYLGESIELLKIAKQICGTDSYKSKIQQDLSLIQKNQKLKEEMGEPISDAPSLFTINGVGSKIYGDTLWFVFLFIPIFAISRYSLEEHGNGTYSFFGKLKLHKWQKYWNCILIALIVLFIGYLFFAPSSSDSYTPSSDYSGGYVPTYIPPIKQTFSTTDSLAAGYVGYYAFSDADLAGNITLDFSSTLPITVYFVPSQKDYDNFVESLSYNKYAGCYFINKNSSTISCDISTGGILIHNSNYQSTSYTIREK